jgi:TonB family protein
MKYLLSLIVVFSCLLLSGQMKVDTIYVDKNLERAFKEDAKFYRCRVLDTVTKLFAVTDYTMDGILFQKATYKDINLKEGIGSRTIYNPDGKIKVEESFGVNEDLKENSLTKKDPFVSKPAYTRPISDNGERMPEFPGGQDGLHKFLSENIHFPEKVKKRGISGKVYVQFLITATGAVTNAKVVRGVGGWCDEEAIRVVSMMPNWAPAEQRGKKVSVLFNVPIIFS